MTVQVEDLELAWKGDSQMLTVAEPAHCVSEGLPQWHQCSPCIALTVVEMNCIHQKT